MVLLASKQPARPVLRRGVAAAWLAAGRPGTYMHPLALRPEQHPTAAQRIPLLQGLVTSVAAGGTLLSVGHPYAAEPAALWGADRVVAADELAADLDPRVWDVQVAEQRSRTGGGEGHHHADEIVRARRR